MIGTPAFRDEHCINDYVHLKVDTKYHLSQKQVTVHSVIFKVQGEKSYRLYLAYDTTHDQVFVNVSICEMLKEVDEEMFRDGTVLIQSKPVQIVHASTN